jgi:hypothetical protein
MATKFVDDFASLANWTNQASNASISPTGWAYSPGNSGASAFLSRARGTDTYCECKVYLDLNNSDWCMMKIDTGITAMFNNGAGDGCGIAMRGSGSGFAFLGGTISGWTGSWTLATRPGAAATACTLGIYKRSSTTYDFYCNGALLGTQTTNTATTGTNITMGGYNGVGAHFDYFASSDRLLTAWDDKNAPSPMSY